MTREQLGVLRDARDTLCRACNAVECETCYVPRLIEKHERETEEVAPVVHGRWLPRAVGNPDSKFYYCSHCKADVDAIKALYYSFCPECGAKMDQE